MQCWRFADLDRNKFKVNILMKLPNRVKDEMHLKLLFALSLKNKMHFKLLFAMSLKKCISNCCLQNVVHFASTLVRSSNQSKTTPNKTVCKFNGLYLIYDCGISNRIAIAITHVWSVDDLTNNFSFAIRIRCKIVSMQFISWVLDCSIFLRMPRQLCCRSMCKNTERSQYLYFTESLIYGGKGVSEIGSWD